MLKSFDESYEQIQDVFQKHNQEDRLSIIDNSMMLFYFLKETDTQLYTVSICDM